MLFFASAASIFGSLVMGDAGKVLCQGLFSGSEGLEKFLQTDLALVGKDACSDLGAGV